MGSPPLWWIVWWYNVIIRDTITANIGIKTIIFGSYTYRAWGHVYIQLASKFQQFPAVSYTWTLSWGNNLTTFINLITRCENVNIFMINNYLKQRKLVTFLHSYSYYHELTLKYSHWRDGLGERGMCPPPPPPPPPGKQVCVYHIHYHYLAPVSLPKVGTQRMKICIFIATSISDVQYAFCTILWWLLKKKI